jgi:hypothetical protein
VVFSVRIFAWLAPSYISGLSSERPSLTFLLQYLSSNERNQKAQLESHFIFQVTEVDILGQGGSSRSGMKWLDSGYMLRVTPKRIVFKGDLNELSKGGVAIGGDLGTEP